MERMIARVLSLLKESKHSHHEVRLKVDCAPDRLRLLLERGEAQKLWLKDTICQDYMISDTGELSLERSMIKDMLKVHRLKLAKPGFDRILRKLKHVEVCLTSLRTP